MKKNVLRRGLAFLLAVTLLVGYIPAISVSAEDAPDLITTVADPETLTRPELVYGDNTLNSGKVTVGKSVEAATGGSLSVEVNGQTITGDPDNFLVTITQTAQVMGLTTESAVPLDVVFVLDASNSMNQSRRRNMVAAANEAIETLMAANSNNRVAVVAFSGVNSSYSSATTLLTPLDHYTGDAATNHLRWSNSSGTNTGSQSDSRNYILGRNNNGTAGIRNANSAGTNLQAGIAAGARVLTDLDNNTTVTVDGTVMTRMPFLVVLSDGAASCHSSSQNWYDPNNSNQGAGSVAENLGSGFIAATTAAYYKGLITEKYYGTNASKDNRATIYTIGVEVSNAEVAQMAINPLQHFVSTSTSSNYKTFKDWWDSFTAEPASNFTISVNNGRSYTFTAASINAARNLVMGKSSNGTVMYNGGLAYNDDYFDATSADEISQAFRDVVAAIQKKAISVPTQVTGAGADFSGYVNFYDPIGEYMEVKDMKGIVANGHYYQGRTFANLLMNPGTNAEFDSTLERVLTTRLSLANSPMTAATLMAEARTNKAEMNDTSNSFCWYGMEYDVGEEDIAMQVLASAKDDSISYIQNNTAPAGATHVCRSYFFYGTAGNTVQNPNHEYLYFVVRVQRSLVAPYQQTVVISAPASLLSMEKVSITENADGTFTAQVEEHDPARVVYEVGLRSDINPQNVTQIVGSAYTGETVNGSGSVNYDAATGTYNFFTNDWNRSVSQDEHHRAMAKATFDAAADNSFYTYQEHTPLLVKSGSTYVPYTGAEPAVGQVFYYERTYYSWEGATADANGNLAATKETAYIPVTVPSGVAAHSHIAQDASGQWYIKKGTYTAATIVSGDDALKAANITGTAVTVKHVHNTTNMANSHYTVLLGNNGMLSLVADTTKSVTGSRPTDTSITLTDGSTVMIGDELTYTVKVVNNADSVATAVVTDKVPAGTSFVSAGQGGTYDAASGIVTWNLSGIAAKSQEYVSFTVEVTEDALSEAVVSVDNTATVTLSNGASYTTNTTHNPPFGKTVSDTNGADLPADGVQVGQEMIYRIRFANDEDTVSDVYIKDIIPAGTRYLEGTASHNGQLSADGKSLEWTLSNVQPHTYGVVTFRVIVDASAKNVIENDATIRIGENGPEVRTNPTETLVKSGDLTVSKAVTVTSGAPATTEFTLLLTEAAGDLSGVYAVTGSVAYTQVQFVNGKAFMLDANGDPMAEPGLKIKDGESLTIVDLPANADIVVTENEANKNGFTTTYTGLNANGAATIPVDTAAAVAVTNNYATTPADFQLHGQKQIIGTLPGEVVFTFTSQTCDADGNVAADAVTVTAIASAVPGTDKIDFSFSPRTFSAAGTYRYLVTETMGSALGVTYDTTKYMLVVTVADNGLGALSASHKLYTLAADNTYSVEESALVFENTYTDPEVQVSLEASKVLNGRHLKANEFAFQVVDASGSLVATGMNTADGKIAFSPIAYTAEGTHTYTISEVQGSLTGVTYSAATFNVTVTVTKNAQNQLEANVSYPAGGVVFTNEYNTGASVSLEARKVLTGVRTQLNANEFSFVVLDGDGNVVATGTNDAAGSIAFSPIGYTLKDMGTDTTKDFSYTIKEVIPSVGKDPFIQYSTDVIGVTVTVSYDAATGILSVAAPVYAGGAVPTFTNNVNENYVTATPDPLTKATTGVNIPTGATFSFSVLNMQNKVVGSGNGVANGAITFAPLTFTAPGTYSYWIQESSSGSSAGNGITYDDTRYLWTVEIGYAAAASKLVVVSQSYNAYNGTGDVTDPTSYTTALAAPHFSNVYAANGMATVSAAKVLTGGRTLFDGEFEFQLVRDDDTSRVIIGTNKADGSVTFGSLYYTNSDFAAGETTKTVYYTMTELKPVVNAVPGITYSEEKYYVAVELTLNGEDVDTNVVYYTDAAHTQPLAAGEVPTFTNRYQADDTSTVIQVEKVLNGRDLKAGEFSFELIHVQSETEQTVVETATNDASGKVTFHRNYYAATFPTGSGTTEIKYLIKEVNGGLGGVSYDTTVYGVVVPVTHDVAQGKLIVDEANIKYYLGEDFTTEATQMVFTNTYEAEDTSVTPVAHKVLTGRTLADHEFAFQVKDIATNAVVSTGLSMADGSVVFTPIVYADRPGAGNITQIYEISEAPGSLGGVTYDTVKYYLSVNVVDDGAGTITATPKYYTDSALTNEITDLSQVVFTNRYTTGGTSIQLEGTKTLNGRSLGDGEFDFVVKEGDVVVTYGTHGAAENGKPAKITFGTISYTAAGTHEYVISEIVPSNAASSGITVDTRTFTVTVVVRDDGQGNLIAEATYGEPVAFVNEYDASPVDVVLTAQKYLINKKLTDGEFLFKLSGNGLEKTATNDESGLVTFETISFSAPGTYTFNVSEVIPADPNTDPAQSYVYSYDNSVYTATVEVTDNGAGQLVAAVSYTKNGEAAQAMEFLNSYTPKEIVINLTDVINADKTLNGRSLIAGEFNFRIIDISKNVLATGTNDAEGNISFTSLRFTTAGIYNYRIEEDLTGLPGAVTGDERQWRLQIHVRYDETSGQLTIDTVNDVHIRDLNNVDVEGGIVFENTYTPDPITVSIPMTKTLEGRPLNAGEFLFQLKEGDLIRDEVRNGGEGHVNFNLTFNKIGTHTFTIHEVNEGKPGIVYTTEVETVTVTVTDADQDGKLEYSLTYGGDKTFVNEYVAQDGTATINVEKQVTTPAGSAYFMAGGEFQFQLLNAAHEEIATASNDPDGLSSFTLHYTKDPAKVNASTFLVAGNEQTFVYYVKEIKGTAPGVTYDDTEHKVIVTVKDDLQGKLISEVSYDTAGGSAALFQNQYDITDSVMVKISGTKSYLASTGESMSPADGQFSFGLYKNGVLLDQVTTNDVNGKFAFVLTYDKNDIGTHRYTVKEIKGTDPCVTYDESVYGVTVVVADNLAGGLTATTTITDDSGVDVVAAAFTNIYTEPDATLVTVNVEKKLNTIGVGDVSLDNFEFVLDKNGEKESVWSDASGKGSFNLTFRAKDVGETFKFTVYEKAGNIPCVTYDTTVYSLQIQGAQNADGTLKTIINGEEASSVTFAFTNTYTEPTPETVTISIQKNVTNIGENGIGAENFQMVLRQGSLEQTATTDKDGKASFSLTFTSRDIGKTIDLSVYERQGSIPGVAYDTTVHDLKIRVEQNPDGSLKLLVNDKEASNVQLSFTNTYTEPDPQSVAINVEKIVENIGQNGIGAENFEFVLKQGDLVQTAVTGKDGKAAFGLTYTSYDIGKTFHVTVSEKKGTIPGVAYDSTVHSLEIQVGQYSNGSLKITINGVETTTASLKFTNTYTEPDPQSVTINVVKQVENIGENGIGAENFEIVLKQDGQEQTAITDKDGKASFTLTYTSADIGKTYDLTVHEKKGFVPGVTYDSTEYDLKVKIGQNPDGSLKITINGVETTSASLSFKNTYTEPDPQSVTINVEKKVELIGENGIGAENFEFVLEQNGKKSSVLTDRDGIASFSLHYTSKDIGKTYKLSVYEKKGSTPGVTYDPTVYDLEVQIGQNADGSLNILVNGEQTNSVVLSFKNTYTEPDPETIAINVVKKVEVIGENGIGAENFEIVLEQDGVEKSVLTDKDGKASFALTYTSLDIGKTYNLTVFEKKGSVPGVAYDSTVHELEIQVDQNADGSLKILVNGKEAEAVALTFNNTYTEPDPETVTINVEKELEIIGENGIGAKGFEIVLKQDGVEQSVLTDKDGKASFDLTYTSQDIGKTFQLSVYEKNTLVPGVTYDTTVYDLEIQVGQNADGSLSITIDGKQTTAASLSFKNIYTEPDPQSVIINVVKTMETVGENGIGAENFEFVLEQDGTEQTAVTDKSGIASFDLHYSSADIGKTYELSVYEKNTQVPGVTYDSTVYDLKIEIGQNRDGSLKISVNGEQTNSVNLAFTNTYTEPDPETVTIDVVKKVENTGLNGITPENFEIVLEQDGTAKSVITDKDGKAGFSLTYTSLDIGKTYKLSVYEKKGNVPGVIYDATRHELEVKVGQNADGSLNISINGQETKSVTLTFTNRYNEPAPVDVVLNIVKKVTNKTLKGIGPENFEIVMKHNGTEKTVKTDKNGKADFTLTFTSADIGKTFTVTISEKKGNTPGVTYDTTVHTLVIQVAQNADGSLKTVINDRASGSATVTFTNTYAEPSTPATGDNSIIVPMVIVMVLSAAGCIFLIILLRRNRYRGRYNN